MIGSPVNARRITDTFRSVMNKNITADTVIDLFDFLLSDKI